MEHNSLHPQDTQKTPNRSSSSAFRPITPFTEDETHLIQHKLNTKLEPECVSYRPGAHGSVPYIEGWRAFSLANEVFGFNGWSSEIQGFTTDVIDEQDGKISVGISCMVRVYLRDGTFHDDIGYGSVENQRSKVAAYEKAKKEAVTDAMKRALRLFGNRLGNCAYDKAFVKELKLGGTTLNPNSRSNQFPPNHSSFNHPPNHYSNNPSNHPPSHPPSHHLIPPYANNTAGTKYNNSTNLLDTIKFQPPPPPPPLNIKPTTITTTDVRISNNQHYQTISSDGSNKWSNQKNNLEMLPTIHSPFGKVSTTEAELFLTEEQFEVMMAPEGLSQCTLYSSYPLYHLSIIPPIHYTTYPLYHLSIILPIHYTTYPLYYLSIILLMLL